MKSIVSYNINAWRPINSKMSYKMTISQIAAYVKRTYYKAPIIALQEVLPGRNAKYLRQIQNAFTEYEMILPIFDVNKHWKSIITIVLIDKSILSSYSVEELSGEYLANRVNYILADTIWGEIRILNLHVPQIKNFKNKPVWYTKERIALYESMYNAIISEAEIHQNENFFILGDLQESENGPHLQLLKALGYLEMTDGQPTIHNKTFPKECIDHILFSKSAVNVFHPDEIVIDSTQVGVLSDHSIISATITA